ncbi:MAG TPA: type I-MYXAN CRISPR-associated protein Cas5/Cmx5/DevS [Pirellulales bacterium]|nr:type I-MYXAN CRISPR-associated protein Cas5/Cmx5/DevS [Pirellulales bacterium]
MLSLYVDAPFAVCRTFTAGWYRPTATFLTPSAAYGLVLNLAGVETRLREEDNRHPGSVPATLTQMNLPRFRLALGAAAERAIGQRREPIDEVDRFPRVQTLYQQLHNYPVGSSGAERAATTFGNKYNIAPVRRELLVGLRAVIAVDGDDEIETRILLGLSGQTNSVRYGLPFLGDNAFLPDRIEILKMPITVHWYERITEHDAKIRARTTRLTRWIDRADLSKTRSDLYAPTEIALPDIPLNAWTLVGSE